MPDAIDTDQIEPNPRHGLRLNFSPEPIDPQHDFCGVHHIVGADCPTCSKPLLRILSLSAKDSRLNVDPARTPEVHLLYCWTCNIPFGTFSYHIRPDPSVELLELPPSSDDVVPFGPGGPYDGYTSVYPMKKVGLVALSSDEQETQERAQSDEDLLMDLMSGQQHQIGGFPAIQNPQPISCPTCSMPSPMLAAMSDDASGNDVLNVPPEQSFTANCDLQMIFHFCRECSVVSAYHST